MSCLKQVLAAVVASAGVLTAHPAAADVVTQWNEQVVTTGGPNIQRTLAMVHIAMFDAVNALQPRYTRYLQDLPAAPANASAEAAAASAAHGVLVRLFPAQQGALDTALATSLTQVPDGPEKVAGVAFGDAVAQAMFLARLGDHILDPGPLFVNGTEPGEYRLTTPGPPQPVNTGAASWLPFALRTPSQFRPNGPPALTSVRYARDLLETEALGGTTSQLRTAEQDIVAVWHTEQGQFSLNRIARNEIGHVGGDLLDHARLFALLNIALADAVTSVFEAKYYYRFWRPVTAIRDADTDGNARTEPDPGWSPFQVTPPHPEYPAAHGVVTTAGTRVLERYFGPHYEFSTTAPTVPGLVRTFASFGAFAEDASFARILGGMHFRSSLEEGQRQGKKVGNWVIDNYLRPLP